MKGKSQHNSYYFVFSIATTCIKLYLKSRNLYKHNITWSSLTATSFSLPFLYNIGTTQTSVKGSISTSSMVVIGWWFTSRTTARVSSTILVGTYWESKECCSIKPNQIFSFEFWLFTNHSYANILSFFALTTQRSSQPFWKTLWIQID